MRPWGTFKRMPSTRGLKIKKILDLKKFQNFHDYLKNKIHKNINTRGKIQKNTSNKNT